MNTKIEKCPFCNQELLTTNDEEIFICISCDKTFFKKREYDTKSSKYKDFIINNNGIIERYIGKSPDVIIPNDLIAIGKGAFRNRIDIRSVIIPKSITNIGESAFANCRNLKSVTILSLNIEVIKEETFLNCSSLEAFVFPHMCKEIGKRAFANCTSLLVADKSGSIDIIREEAFINCISLSQVDFLGFKIPIIEQKAFYNCASLDIDAKWFERSIEITINRYAFFGCSSLHEVSIPYHSTVEEYAFAECKGLEKVNIGDDIILKRGVFANCTKLAEVSFLGSKYPDSAGYSSVVSMEQSFYGTPILKERKKLFKQQRCLICGGQVHTKLRNGVSYYPFFLSRVCEECGADQYYEQDIVLSSDAKLMQPERIKRFLCKYCGHTCFYFNRKDDSTICEVCGMENDY